jgi:hypothetical protein
MPSWSGRCRSLHVERKIFGKASRSEFVNSTGYVTVAERKPDWEELKKQLPPGTPKLDESALVAGAPVFAPPRG